MSTKSPSKDKAPGTAPETGKFRVPSQVIRLNRRVLEGQRSLFDTTYQMVTSFQEGNENALQSALESSRLVPTEVRQIAEAWIGVSRSGRSSFKAAVDKSYELAESWFDRQAASEPAEA
jgi:hypothetical protein